jgi:hypothetical protein
MQIRKRRFFGYAIIAAALIAVAVVDLRLESSSIPGYAPERSFVCAASDDFPLFYSAWGRCDFVTAASLEISAQISELPRLVRLELGIRPTPLRWRVWLGKKLLISAGDDGVGLCFRPGIVFRAAECALKVFGRVEEMDGLRRYGRAYYAWRDGFVVASVSPEYVKASLVAPVPKIDAASGRNEFRFAFRGADGELRIHARDGLPAEGWIQTPIKPGGKSLTASDSWAEAPLAAISASSIDDVVVLLGLARDAIALGLKWSMDEGARARVFDFAAQIEALASSRFDATRLADDWSASIAECSFALLDIDAESATPVPELGLILRSGSPVFGEHPFAAALGAENGIPHEWGGKSGVAIPWIGEKLLLCLAVRDRDWLFATQEPLMARMIASKTPESNVAADAALEIDWKKAGRCAEKLSMKFADSELLPGMNAKDLERDWLPFVRAAARLGSVRLEGRAHDKRLEFKGYLALNPALEEKR